MRVRSEEAGVGRLYLAQALSSSHFKGNLFMPQKGRGHLQGASIRPTRVPGREVL